MFRQLLGKIEQARPLYWWRAIFPGQMNETVNELGINHLVGTQNFPEDKYFLSLDTHECRKVLRTYKTGDSSYLLTGRWLEQRSLSFINLTFIT